MPGPTACFYIDRKWIPCSPGDEYGAIGVRHLCTLGTTPGQPSKNLLVRFNTWSQSEGREASRPLALTMNKVAAGKRFGLRPATGKKYHWALSGDGSKQPVACHVFQQDVSDLAPLGQAITQTLQGDKPQDVWRLFHSCCAALREFGHVAAGSGLPVPLQCPTSLGVDESGRIILLDAEVVLADALPPAGAARRLYAAWFGDNTDSPTAPADQASVLHADALLRFFQQFLPSLRPRLAGAAGKVCDDFVSRAACAPAGRSLEDLEEWIAAQAVDWNIYVEDEEPQAGRPASAGPPPGRKKRSLLLRLSLALNLLLAITVALLLLL